MPRWNKERKEMTILSILMSNNPFSYILGLGLFGMILGIDLWFNSITESFQKPKQLKTAQDYIERGYEVMHKDMPLLEQNDPKQRQANCKDAQQSFQKAISLDSKIAVLLSGARYKPDLSEKCCRWQEISLPCKKPLFTARK